MKKAKANDRSAQKAIFEQFSPKMLSVCRQYIKDVQFAEDVMISGFVKVFSKLETFRGQGSFEGWIRKIMVRESISYLRKRQFVVYDDEVVEQVELEVGDSSSMWDVEHIQSLVDTLPEGYKTVFLLYAVEGYKHHEIAELLDISEGTSKSQLFKARQTLQENLRLGGAIHDTRSRSK